MLGKTSDIMDVLSRIYLNCFAFRSLESPNKYKTIDVIRLPFVSSCVSDISVTFS